MELEWWCSVSLLRSRHLELCLYKALTAQYFKFFATFLAIKIVAVDGITVSHPTPTSAMDNCLLAVTGVMSNSPQVFGVIGNHSFATDITENP